MGDPCGQPGVLFRCSCRFSRAVGGCAVAGVLGTGTRSRKKRGEGLRLEALARVRRGGQPKVSQACLARRRFTNQAVAGRVCSRQGSGAGEEEEEDRRRREREGLRLGRARVRQAAPCRHRCAWAVHWRCSSARLRVLVLRRCACGIAGHAGRCVRVARRCSWTSSTRSTSGPCRDTAAHKARRVNLKFTVYAHLHVKWIGE